MEKIQKIQKIEKMGKSINDIFDEACLEEMIEFDDSVYKYIEEENLKDAKDIEKQIHEIHALYRKHTFDDDQSICIGYAKIIAGLKEQMRELSRGKTK
jgi:hypothetical protein